ncbi:MAG: serine/threonine protein kinase, partial [Planctomycetota bacterium]|nr:serine/threonine protein kinase [Planctomycetota bacterium]
MRIGSYEVLAELGRGGVGVVYRARSPQGQDVALKLLLAPLDVRARRRFEREVEALGRLQHPSIAPLLEAGEDQGRPFLVLPLVPGGSLQDHLDRRGALPPADAAALVREVAFALEHAHQAGMLHRDLKPSNVLLAADGRPVVVDFGLTRAVDPDRRSLSRTGQVLGTPGFWSPEQARGDLDALGPAADVFGLGALLHAALTREPPITGATFAELLAATERFAPRPTGLDAGLDAVLVRALQPRPADRH